MAQTAGYIDRCAADAGHLVVFDRDPDKRWQDKVFHRRETRDGVDIHVWEM